MLNKNLDVPTLVFMFVEQLETTLKQNKSCRH